MGALGAQLGMGLLDSLYTPQITTGLHVDPQGNYVDADGNPTTPYVKPGFMSRVISPTARQIAGIDAESSLAPMEAQRANSIRNTVGGGNFQKMRDAGVTGQGFANLPDDVGFMANPSMSPEGYQGQGTAILNNQGGIQGNTSGIDLTQSQTMLQAAKAAANRQPVVDATTDANTATGYRAATSLTPTLTANEITRARGTAGRMGQEQSNLDTAGQVQAKELANEGTQADLARMFQSNEQDMWPVTKDTANKNAYAANAAATYRPPVSRLATIQSANGNQTLGANPVGLSHMDEAMVNAGQPLPSSTVMGPDGRAIVVPHTLHPSVVATSQQGSGPSTRPTVAQTSIQQDQPQTVNVADTQAAQYRPTVSDSNIGRLPSRLPSDEDEDDLQHFNITKEDLAGIVDKLKKAGVHSGHTVANVASLFLNGGNKPYPNW